jgi:hypothetical protein
MDFLCDFAPLREMFCLDLTEGIEGENVPAADSPMPISRKDAKTQSKDLTAETTAESGGS